MIPNILNSFYGNHGGLNMELLRGLRAAAYARYSDEKKKKKGKEKEQSTITIDFQFKKIGDFCLEYGIDIVAWFKDEGETGTNMDREDFNRLVQGARAQQYDIVVIYDLTRGSRDVVDWFSFRKEMRILGLPVLSATEKLGDITNPSDFLTELITVGIGQHHVLQTRLKTIDAIAQLASQGKFCGGTPNLGYDIVDGYYIINDHEARGVAFLFRAYAAGKSLNYIVDALASPEYSLKSKRGNTIGTNAVHEILKNVDKYAGDFIWNKRIVKFFRKWAGGKENPNMVRIKGGIPRIIDDETRDKVKSRLEKNKHNKLNKGYRDYLLSGLLCCAKCGGAFTGVTTINKKGIEYKFYSCCTKKRLRTCDAKNIAANDIEPLVVNLVKNELLNGEMIEMTADAIIAASEAHNKLDNTESLKKEIVSLNGKIFNLMKVLADGFDSDSVRENIKDFEARKKILEQKLREIIPPTPIDRKFLLKELRKDVEKLQNDPKAIKEILNKYIVNIKIADDCIEINAISDLTTVGCGGTQQAVFKYIIPRRVA